MKGKVELCESTLKDASVIANWLKDSEKLTENAELGPLGRLWVRVALHLTDKEKSGREATTMSIEQIRTAYLTELTKIVKQPVVYDAWKNEPQKAETDGGAEKGEVTKEPELKKPRVVSAADHSDPVWIANSKGLREGIVVYQRGGDHAKAENLWKITKVGQKISLDIVCNYAEADPFPTKTVDLKEMIENWSIFKNETPVFFFSCGENLSKKGSVDAVKCKLYQALHAADNGTVDKVKFYRKPDLVLTTQMFAKGALKLFPFVPLQNIITKKATNGIMLGKFDGLEYYAIAPPKVPQNAPDKWEDEYYMVAFWWVTPIGPKEAESAANMAMSHVVKDGIKIPVLTNRVELKPFTKLTMVKRKA